MSDKIIILEHEGTSYIRTGYQTVSPENMLVNGQAGAAQTCPGNPRWLMVSGSIQTLARIPAPGLELVGWILKPEYRDVTTFPAELGADAFRYEYDEDEEDCYIPTDPTAVYKSVFYEKKHQNVQREPEPLEFMVIDRDCAPKSKPDDVKVEFPASLREYPETWHKHPVTIDGNALFGRAATALVEAARERSGDFAVTDHRNIGTVTLMGYMHHEPKQNDYKVGGRTVRRTQTKSEFRIMELASAASNYAKSADIVCRGLSGSDWADLESKINGFIDLVLSYIKPGSVRVCECCKGDGYIVTVKP
ncbi:hypothetical protein LMG26685_02159 [Achromobacter mucicolens]|uniref:hypothetical protein n=1 Tax=Achromobacter mucicolens TaxID=1389922 RepID=UPI000B92065C|nr:hypothetical protein [Achromobacter mucicolens]OXC91356.1 hypothetical protein BMR85_009595 [Achromobacter sp. KAs 3-5]CAB3643420.1 hypothetical protein LMG26685_02159 [Achromobacter mucicolens]